MQTRSLSSVSKHYLNPEIYKERFLTLGGAVVAIFTKLGNTLALLVSPLDEEKKEMKNYSIFLFVAIIGLLGVLKFVLDHGKRETKRRTLLQNLVIHWHCWYPPLMKRKKK